MQNLFLRSKIKIIRKSKKLFLRGVVKNIASNNAVFVNVIAIPSRCIKSMEIFRYLLQNANASRQINT